MFIYVMPINIHDMENKVSYGIERHIVANN